MNCMNDDGCDTNIYFKNHLLILSVLTVLLICSMQSRAGQMADTIRVRMSPTDSKSKIGLITHQDRTQQVNDLTPYTNTPEGMLMSQVRRLYIDRAQHRHERFLVGEISRNDFEKFIIAFTVDTSFLYHGRLSGNYVDIFVGLDHNQQKHVIVDQNNSQDFGDDTHFTFDLKTANTTIRSPNIPVEVCYYDGVSIRDTVLNIVLSPFDSYFSKHEYKDEHEHHFDFIIEDHYTLYGLLEHEGDSLGLIVTHPTSNDWIKSRVKNGNRFLLASSELYPYSVRDTFIWNDKGYLILSFNDRDGQLGVDLIEVARPEMNPNIGYTSPPIHSVDLITGEEFLLHNFRGKYVLLDFWGSWCGPCIDLLPEIHQLHSKVDPEQVEFVSVALDRQRDIPKLKNLIQQHKMDWHHLWQDREKVTDPGSIVRTYQVNDVPTFILLDRNNQILMRGTGREELIKIADYLEGSIPLDE